ncbi:MAG: DUF742 domain-containing protein [Frankia sp.]
MPTGEEWFDEDAGPVVRPYAVTRGRTRAASGDLDLVAQVSTTPSGRSVAQGLEPEKRAIARLCIRVQSVAEVSAQLNLPLGVVRVLVGDMAELGVVTIHRHTLAADRPDAAMLEKVLHGLRTL